MARSRASASSGVTASVVSGGAAATFYAFDASTDTFTLKANNGKQGTTTPLTNDQLAALQKTLRTPAVHGDPEGDLLVVGWGSNKGVIEEAVDRVRAEGLRVSSLHLRFIQPMPSGIREILKRFGKVMTVEGNWSDRPEDELIDVVVRRFCSAPQGPAAVLDPVADQRIGERIEGNFGEKRRDEVGEARWRLARRETIPLDPGNAVGEDQRRMGTVGGVE